MSIYIRSPSNEVDGIVIGYAIYHKLLNNYINSDNHCIHDLLNARSPECREELYSICEKHKKYYLSQSDYNSLPANSRPTTNSW